MSQVERNSEVQIATTRKKQGMSQIERNSEVQVAKPGRNKE
jgi:hypothetical protein